MKRYQAVMLQGPGDLEKLEVVELPLAPPAAEQLRIKVVAGGAGSTDIAMRTGKYIYAPPWPFVPGYESIGVVDAL